MVSRRKSILYLFMSSGTVILLFVLMESKYQLQSDLSKAPKVRVDQFLYPPPWILVNNKVQYLINNGVCDSDEVFMLILITSHAGDMDFREHIRKVLPVAELHRLKMRRLFLLAKIDVNRPMPSKYHSVTMDRLLEENDIHHDLLMGDFTESYRNLTYKHLMGLQWAVRYCDQATFILKQDDDVIVDFYQLTSLLGKSSMGEKLLLSKSILGKILWNMGVVRDSTSKWFVPSSEYQNATYPDFVSGWAYITTVKVVEALVKAAETINYFWIDDIHITGTLRNFTDTKLIDLSSYFTAQKGQMQCCISTSASKSKFNRPYWCDYVVGPSNDDLVLMDIFQQHAQFCHTTNMCRRRPENESLDKTCVLTNNMVVKKYRHTEAVGLWHRTRI